jgi:hypothetical protein
MAASTLVSSEAVEPNSAIMLLVRLSISITSGISFQNGTIITVQLTYTGEINGECDLKTRQELKLWLDSEYQAPLSNQPPKAMAGHGTFIYNAVATIGRYSSPENVAAALQELDMQHAWIRIHGRSEMHAVEPTRSLIQALKSAGIYVAGWGWCQGDNVSSEAQLALNALERFELEHYIADIEQGVSGSHWTRPEINEFFTKLRNGLSNTSKVALSTHAFIIWHGTELMREADRYVDYFAPQVYWFSYPNQNLLNAAGVSPQQYPLNDPASYMRLCLKLWRDITEKPVIAAGQIYWGEGDFPRERTEQKLASFLSTFTNWEELQGLNWWHLGGSGQSAMSSTMYTSLKAAKLNSKFAMIN